MSSIDNYLKASEFFKKKWHHSCQHVVIGKADFCNKLEYLKLLKETWMLNANVPLPSNSENSCSGSSVTK